MPPKELSLSTHIALYNDYAIDVPHEILSLWVGEAARMEARIAELEEQIDTQQGLRGLLERVAKAERDAAKYFQWHEDQLAATKKAVRQRAAARRELADKQWVIATMTADIERAGGVVTFHDGGMAQSPSGYHRKPYVQMKGGA